MDHIEAQLKKIRTKLDDVPAFQKAEVSCSILPTSTIRSLMMTQGFGVVAKNNRS